MSEYIIMTDSSCDLTQEMADELELTVVPLNVTIDGKTCFNYLDGREIGFKDFYARMRAGSVAKTSAINQAQALTAIEEAAAAGKDVLFLAFSSGLSATYSAAATAMEQLRPKYPERKLYAVDTLCASLGQGLFIWYCCQRKKAGEDIDQVYSWAEEHKLELCHLFTVDDLMFLKRGGRVSAATAIIGSALSIKPVMHVDDEGHLIKTGIARGRKGSLKALADEMDKRVKDFKDLPVFISHGDCIDDVEYLANLIRSRHSEVGMIHTNYVGPVIGAHSGPGTVALFFMGSPR
ncbi:MAG: DegV family protein [Clostridia bacterium]|nr:DegV family protein [Clostridia bacterium]